MKFKPRTTTDYIVVHNAASSPSMQVDAHEIGRWHRARGYLAIGYHFVITRDGRWEKGRPMDVEGAHVRGLNHRTIGICLPGGITEREATPADGKAAMARGFVALPNKPEQNFTEEQYASLVEMILMLWGSYPDAQVVGHGDLDPRKPHCPGFSVAQFLKDRGLD